MTTNNKKRWLHRQAFGFTLLELIAVTVAFAVLAAAGVTTYKTVITRGQDSASKMSLQNFAKSASALYAVRTLDNAAFTWNDALAEISSEGIMFSLDEGVEAAGSREVALYETSDGSLGAYDGDGPVSISATSFLQDNSPEVVALRATLGEVTLGDVVGLAMRSPSDKCAMTVIGTTGILGTWAIDTDAADEACWGLRALQQPILEEGVIDLTSQVYSVSTAGAPKSNMIAIQENNGDLANTDASQPSEDGSGYTLRWNLSDVIAGTDENIVIKVDPDGNGPLSASPVTCAGQNSTLLTSTTTSCVINGLTEGQEYTYSIVVVDADGQESAPITLTDATRPAAVTQCSYTMTPTSAALSWGAPSGKFNGFRVTVDGNEIAPVAFASGTSTYGSALSNLTTGTTYAVTITTYNSSYDAASACSLSVTPVDAPDQVENVGIATPTDEGKLSVSWDAVSSSSAKPISGYRVYLYDSALSGFIQIYQTGGTTAELTFAQGDWGIAQQVQVSAYSAAVSAYNPGNVLGEGVRSETAVGTPIAAPNAASNAELAAYSNGGVTLNWSLDPTTARPISSVLIKEGGATVETLGATATSRSIDGLTPGKSYTFTIVPTNSVGNATTGAASTVTVTAVTVPDAPSGLNAELTNVEGKLDLSWNAVTSTASKPVTGYRLFQYNDAVESWLQIAQTASTSANVTGLTLGTSYGFRVATYGNGGEGERSSTVNKTPIGAAVAASRATVSYASNGAVTLTYTVSASNARPLSSLVVTASGGVSRTASIDGSTATVTFPGGTLTPGNSYQLVVRAANDFGNTDVNDTPDIVAVDAPDATGSVTAALTSSEGAVLLSWNAVGSSSAKPVTGYRVYQNTAGNWLQVAQLAGTSTTITGLTLGNTEEFAVSTYGTGGEGSRSGSSSITVVGAPATANRTGVSYADASAVTLTYEIAPTDARPVTAVVVTATPDEGSAVTANGSISGNTVTVNFAPDALDSGVTYTVSVRTTNAFGNTDASDSTLTAVSVPTAPSSVNVALTATEGALSVTWDSVSSSSAKPVSGYRVYQNVSGNWLQVAQLSGTTTTVTGLTLGNSHEFSVATYGSAGEGARSSQASLVAIGAPGSASDVSITATNGTLTASWTAADSTASRPVVSYELQIYQGASLVSGTSTLTTSETLSGLTNGTTYTVKVRAENSFGKSATAAEASSTPYAAPAQVTGLALTQNAEGGLGLSWNSVSSTSAAPVSGYRIFQGTSSGSLSQVAQQAGTTLNVTGLTAGTTYIYAIAAYGPISQGLSSTEGSAVAINKPNAVTMGSSTFGDRSIILNWTAVTATTANPVANVIVKQGATTLATLAANATTYTVTGLTAGTSYGFSVLATNAVGDGTAGTDTQTAVTVPAAPTVYGENPSSATCWPASNYSCQENGQITVVWTAVSSTGSAPVSGYRVFQNGTQVYQGAGTSSSGALTNAVTGLSNGTDYTITVAAYGSGGQGASGQIVMNPATTPSAPSSVSLSAPSVSGQLDVSFSGQNSNGETISSYTVTCTSSNGGTQRSGSGTASPISVTSVSAGYQYYCQVTATSKLGTSSSSASSNTVAAYSPYGAYGAYSPYGAYGAYSPYGAYGAYTPYGAYGAYSPYGAYGAYSPYGAYGAYGPYGAYGAYGPYGAYGAYGPYGAYGAYAPSGGSGAFAY
jgi:hypothetical protein